MSNIKPQWDNAVDGSESYDWTSHDIKLELWEARELVGELMAQAWMKGCKAVAAPRGTYTEKCSFHSRDWAKKMMILLGVDEKFIQRYEGDDK